MGNAEYMGHFDTCLSPLTFNMKSFALVLALVAVAVAKPDFEACPGFEDNTFVNPWKLTINPDPIVAKEGESVEIHFDATVLKTLPVGTKVEFKMVKSGIPLPCLPIPGLPIHIGSCSYDAEDLLALITPEDCKKFAPEGQACSLPLNPGFYGGKDPNGSKAFVLPASPSSSSPSSAETSRSPPRPPTPTVPSTSACKTLSLLSPTKSQISIQLERV